MKFAAPFPPNPAAAVPSLRELAADITKPGPVDYSRYSGPALRILLKARKTRLMVLTEDEPLDAQG